MKKLAGEARRELRGTEQGVRRARQAGSCTGTARRWAAQGRSPSLQPRTPSVGPAHSGLLLSAH